MTPRPPAASIHGVDRSVDGAFLVVVGTCRRDGVGGTVPPDQLRLQLVDEDGRVLLAVPAAPALRFEDGDRRWTGFTAEIPLREVPVGSTFPLLSIGPGPGHDGTTIPAMAAIGMIASSRPVTTAGRTVQVLPASGSGRVEIVCRDGGRSSWTRAMLRRDLPDVLRRRPFATARLVRLLTRPLVPRGPIWLVGERSDTARDNGFHLFAHLRRERPDVRAYYVIDRDSDQRSRVEAVGRVVVHSSRQHRRLMRHADVLANAYSFKHMVPRQWDAQDYLRHLSWRVGARRIYLKHGINVNTTELRRRTTGYDLYLTATAAETAAAKETSGYDRQVVETGLPRFDALTPTPRSRTILFMPTWRLYLAAPLFSDAASGDVPFEGSEYQRFVHDLLTSPRLLALLERHDHRIQLMPHYNLRGHLADAPVASDRVDVLGGDAGDIQDVLRTCDLFVTDHSSVHFDVAYLGTPVVYAHFDEADYRTRHAAPSWFDHRRDGFGPVVHDVEGTIDAIAHYLERDCRREPEYDARAASAFTYRDRDSSRRVVEAVEHLLPPGE